VSFLLSGWQSKKAVLVVLKSAGVAEAALNREPEYALNPLLGFHAFRRPRMALSLGVDFSVTGIPIF
jgi:hypothetical protein